MYEPQEGDTYDNGEKMYLFTNNEWVYYATIIKGKPVKIPVCTKCGVCPANLPNKLCKFCSQRRI